MNGQTKHSSMFLLELMIAILFFCLASTVCIQLFVKSHMISQDTENLNMAINQVTTTAEVFRSGTDMTEFLEKEFPEYEERLKGAEFLVYYNEKWEACSEKKAVFCLNIKISRKGRMKEGNFSMREIDSSREIYAVSLDTVTGE